MRTARGSTGAALSVLALGALLLSGCAPTGESEPAPATPSRAAESAPTDPFVDYFADKEVPDGSNTMHGSFGAEGEVAPAGWISSDVAPGEYAVTVECAGASAVDFWLTAGEENDRRGDATGTIACPGSMTVALSTAVEGWSLELDSRGEPGAYWVSATPSG